ncbi:glycosyltransferase family protein [Limibacter armeniacum]|uniref:glycosyltransferase family protein n=1 Tax=Limibacter armeniacum TaxID=466084 RepID=UPI002FE5461E
MRVLYAIQGTGNGHLSRARDIVPALQKYCEVDLLISGTQAEVQLPFEVKYRYKGMSFVFGKEGGVALWETVRITKPKRFRNEIASLPIQQYDLVINDFEPVSAWAAFLKGVPCVSLSHQCAVLSEKAPKPKKGDKLGKFILENYAPVQEHYGFHFDKYSEGIFTPVIRKEVRELEVTDQGHYTVYLPSYADKKLLKHLSKFEEIRWEVFSKHCQEELKEGNITIKPISNKAFIESMASSKGVLCGAGFETPAEALYMKKKLLVIPMKNQYEQQCNAAALKNMGVPVIKSLKKKHYETIQSWLESAQLVEVNYPDNAEEAVKILLEDFQAHMLSDAYEFAEELDYRKNLIPQVIGA